jgi:hypothetical protein
MSFKGDLNDFELREIMNFIGERMKDGQLVLKTGDRQATVEFGKGKITRVSLHKKPALIFRLEESGFVPVGTAAKLAGEEQDDISQRQLVLSKKLVEKDDFRRFLVREVAKDLAELMFWEEAEFEFNNTKEPPPPLVELKVDDAVSEAISMSVKLRDLKKRFPDGTSLSLNDSSIEKLITLDPEEWGIIARFTKKMNVEDLAKATGLDGFSFFELLARVADHGLLSAEEAEHAEKAEKAEKKPEVETKTEPKAEPQGKKQQERAPINGKYVAVA